MDKLDALIAQAQAGRGLWVGLSFLTPGEPLKFSVSGYPQIDDPHCTLVHLGKQAALMASSVLKCAEQLSRETPPFDARIGGTARFSGSEQDGDPLVWLLEAPLIRSLAVRFRDMMLLSNHPLRNSGYFDYKPHVTICRIPRADDVTLPHAPKLTFTFRSVIVVCGDERTAFPFKG